MRMHNVFHMSLLKPYKRDGRVQPPPIPIIVDGEEWFTVERILDHKDVQVVVKGKTKHSPAKNKLQCQYLVKWLGYDNEHNTWEPETDISKVEAFKAYTSYLAGLPTHE